MAASPKPPVSGEPHTPPPPPQAPHPYPAAPPQYPAAPPLYAAHPQYLPLAPAPTGGLPWRPPNICRFCGASPAASVSVRAHRGIIVVMTFRELDGPFCRTCGIAAVRTMTAQTLVQGWWGILSALITPLMLIANLVAYLKLRRLPEPAPHRPGLGLDPGKPLLRRWQSVGFVILLGQAALVALIISGGRHFRQPDDIAVGHCAQKFGLDSDAHLMEVDCGPDTYQVLKKLPGTTAGSGCPADTTKLYIHDGYGTSDSFVLCLEKYGA